jgi:hypothetical protein
VSVQGPVFRFKEFMSDPLSLLATFDKIFLPFHPFPTLDLSVRTSTGTLPCCCVDAECTTCARSSDLYVANQCVIRLNVTACARVQDWTCRQSSDLSRPPEWQITLVSSAIILGGLAVAVGLKALGSEPRYRPVSKVLSADLDNTKEEIAI